MSSQAEQAVVWCVALGLVGLALYQNHQSARSLFRMKRHSSRFPLFAIRDELVGLVADGKMSETDESWRAAYEAVSNFLCLDRPWDFAYVLEILASADIASKMNPEYERKLGQFRRKLQVAKRDVPEFGRIVVQIDRALFVMAHERTSKFWWWRVKMMAYARTAISHWAALSSLREILRKERAPSALASFGRTIRIA